MGLEWAARQNSGRKVLESERLGQISKTTDTLIIPHIVTNNKLATHLTGVSDNCKLSLNEVRLCLVSDQVCDKNFPLIMPMVVYTPEFGENSALRDHKKYFNECP